jgi:hypothetical protein
MKLTEKQLRVLILSEVKRISEDAAAPLDPAAIKSVVVLAEKLLSAVNSFLATASDDMKAALPHLEECKKTLENMLSSPSSYVAKPTPVAKKISFKAVEG